MSKPTEQEIEELIEYFDSIEKIPGVDHLAAQVYKILNKDHFDNDDEAVIQMAVMIGVKIALVWSKNGDICLEGGYRVRF